MLYLLIKEEATVIITRHVQSMQKAVTEYGAFKGGFMALKRILRCNPFVKGGYDPVPVKGAVNVKKITK